VSLAPEDIERIAQRVAQLIGPELDRRAQHRRYVDAARLAEWLGVERDWIYAHARSLGAIRLGGPRGRLRFDLQRALQALDATDEGPPTARDRSGRPTRRRRRSKAVDLIPYAS
jgi:hypothetical protein